jgi:4-aminobutyrate aminotransferase-like enzyme/Ser/Thr protein kinase RdoA (MazF antagonist)
MNNDSVFDQPKPALTPFELTGLLARDYGVAAELTPLVSERDQNWRVDGDDLRAVLKISNAAEDRAFLDLQNTALQHLACSDPDLGVPRLLPAVQRDLMVNWPGAGTSHCVRLLSYLPGTLYSAAPKSPQLLASLGDFMGRFSRAMRGFGHPAAHRPQFLWNLDAALAVEPWLADVASAHQALLGRVFQRYRARVLPRLMHLRVAVLHQDANDNNLLVNGDEVSGLIDFGDMCFGRQINELAVTLAYALMDVADLHTATAALLGAYTRVFPIEADEAEVLFDLVAMRLAMSVCISSHRGKANPDNAYLRISQAPALRLLDRLDQGNPAFLAAFARQAAGLTPVPAHATVVEWLQSPASTPVDLFDFSLDRSGRVVVSLSAGAPGMQYAGDPLAYWDWLQQRFAAEGARFALGLYGEDRRGEVYDTEQFATPMTPERRSQHLGIDLFLAADTALHAPLAGRVYSVVDNALAKDYGPTVILQHQAGSDGPLFWTLYGHLSRETLALLRPGMPVQAGQHIGWIGGPAVNGGWAPHLHFQIICDLLELHGDFPGAGQPSLWPLWRQLCPDPNLILRLAPESYRVDATPPALLLERRARLLAPSLSISYSRKLKIVRGRGAYLYDHSGRAYLDAVNNICHVGHSHPRVVAALARQASILNTNTRYLHDTILEYAERLGKTFAAPLSVIYLVCSGSEANELALRIARTVTGRRHTIAVDWGYHGNTNACIEVSAYKFNRKGGRGKAEHIELATLPDPYRGEFKGYGADAGQAYARSVSEKIEIIRSATGQGPSAFIAEAISGCGGQVVFPDTYLKTAAQMVRAAGGLVIIDEVQTGFGRVGNHLWAHGPQNLVPDIVTLGKPIGNGHPMAAVVTTPEIARAFANGMEFFSSFGGNPVSCAVGMAVLDVLEDEQLQERARRTGDYLKAGLNELASRFPLIGDVRGRGLFLGVDLVLDQVTKAHATREAGLVVNHMREAGVLLSTDGPFDNVLKIKPPLAFGRPEADLLLEALADALEDPAVLR